MIYKLKELNEMPSVEKNGSWEIARPIVKTNFFKRIKAAFLVLTNNAICVKWY